MCASRSSSLWSDFRTLKAILLVFGLLNYILWVATLVICSSKTMTLPTPLDIYAWSIGQTFATLGLFRPISKMLTQKAWDSFATKDNFHANLTTMVLPPIAIPTLSVQDFIHNDEGASLARVFLESTYGPDWRGRPILLKGLWAHAQLTDPTRRLSPRGLLEMADVSVPYFSDATVPGALEPDAKAPVSEIVSGMVHENKPHKIGSQFLVQTHPSLLQEVVPPNDFLKELFGNHFSKRHLNMGGLPKPEGSKLFGWQLPGTTTVPVFVANTNNIAIKTTEKCNAADEVCLNPSAGTDSSTKATANRLSPVTGLHCEPIANIATQLSGSRTWTLVDPKHTWRLKPAISKDGRAFFPSWIDTSSLQQIERYQVTTHPGDAVWLPTWTYHKVDYVYGGDNNEGQLQQLSIGASLFHFRPVDFIRRNPLFAFLLVPSLINELVGIKTQ